MKILTCKSIFVCLWFVFVFCLAGQALAVGQVNAFIYHRFGESRYPSTNIEVEAFRQQLTYLREHDYQVFSLEEVVRRLRASENLPEKAAVLTVDDAFTSFAEGGMPIVREFGFPITLFVNTDAVGDHGYLDWEQIKALHEEGVEIGNHTASHAYLVEMAEGEGFDDWRKRIVMDIERAQQEFAGHLGFTPTTIAYPYGEYADEVVEIVKQLGFKAALAQQSGVIHSTSDLYALPRFPMGGPYATLKEFADKLLMKPLAVIGEEPYSPILQENPPKLLLQIDVTDVDMRRVNCFVQGENSCRVEVVTGQEGWYRVQADLPLSSSRRNKYTLTVPGKKGGWHWYSHLWVNAKSPALKNRRNNGQEMSAASPQADVGEAIQSVGANQ
ncbi:polysaccharide deacetylase family protein [Malonomonas rubra]|uniref:polysaccharide deacetylase family protein n=1 Tax=Malonomonas rubra TaxID=57040 RepID=UPI0026F07022|nr:polysaccharide deacetylase family protein [Malonomonas rubra]